MSPTPRDVLKVNQINEEIKAAVEALRLVRAQLKVMEANKDHLEKTISELMLSLKGGADESNA